MQDRGDFDLDSMTHKYCVSCLGHIPCLYSGSKAIYRCMELPLYSRFVNLFCHNSRPLDHLNVPLMQERAFQMNEWQMLEQGGCHLKSSLMLISQYLICGHGGHLTQESHFGNDPLAGNYGLIAERNRQFHQQYPDLSTVFHTISNNNCTLFV